MQLVVDGKVELLDTMKNKRIASAEVLEKFGVAPNKVIQVQALAGASGTLSVASGNSQTVQSLNSSLTSLSPGDIGGMISALSASNYNLGLQIAQQQDYLANSKASLEQTYSTLEATVGQLNAAGQSLSGIT